MLRGVGRVLNSLTAFAAFAGVLITVIIGTSLAMCWYEHRMLGTRPARRTAVGHPRRRESAAPGPAPASAAEKLLLQGKPGAAKSQRLLAIQSLGVLGVPEALPFLIEWSQEKDAEVAAAASKSIREIHLNPRR